MFADYVFDGKKLAYAEEDKTNPLNFYGLSKLLGEKKILDHKLSNSIIIELHGYIHTIE